MALTLTITSGQADALGPNSSKSFSAEGGSIGRSSSCDWVLPDPQRFISGKHVQLSCQDGEWYLTDNSTNGAFLNRSQQPVGTGNRVKLNEGDLIGLGEYEIEVAFTPDEPRVEPAVPPGEAFLAGEREPPSFLAPRGGTAPPGAPAEAPPPLDTGSASAEDFPPFGAPGAKSSEDLWAAPPPRHAQELADKAPVGEGSLDPLDYLGGAEPKKPLIPKDQWPEEGAARPGPGAQEDHAPGTESFFQPPAAHSEVIPGDWDEELMPGAAPEAPVPPAPPPRPITEPAPPPPAAPPPVGVPPAQAPSAAAGGDALLRAFLRGAGLPEDATLADDPEQALEVVGSVFRAVVQGLMAALMARTSIKGEFRMEQTSIRPVENNPLKFSVGVDDALHNLLLEQGEKFLQPVDAFKEGFQDIKDHQMATMAGMRASYEAFMVRLSPRNVQQHAGKGSKLDAMLGGARKAKLWDAYEELYDKTLKDVEDDFQRVVGEAFARAYDEQIRLLARARRRSR